MFNYITSLMTKYYQSLTQGNCVWSISSKPLHSNCNRVFWTTTLYSTRSQMMLQPVGNSVAQPFACTVLLFWRATEWCENCVCA